MLTGADRQQALTLKHTLTSCPSWSLSQGGIAVKEHQGRSGLLLRQLFRGWTDDPQIELAVVAMLHDKCELRPCKANNTNTYACGSIGGDNVVITSSQKARWDDVKQKAAGENFRSHDEKE